MNMFLLCLIFGVANASIPFGDVDKNYGGKCKVQVEVKCNGECFDISADSPSCTHSPTGAEMDVAIHNLCAPGNNMCNVSCADRMPGTLSRMTMTPASWYNNDACTSPHKYNETTHLNEFYTKFVLSRYSKPYRNELDRTTVTLGVKFNPSIKGSLTHDTGDTTYDHKIEAP